MKRRLVTLAGLTGLAALSLLSGLLLFETPRPRSSRGSDPVVVLPKAAPTPARAPASFESLTASLMKNRKHDTVPSRRERTLLLHEIARLRTKESRAFLLDLARRENVDPVERLAAISALGTVGDAKALDAIASSTSDALVHAKIKVVRDLKLNGGRS